LQGEKGEERLSRDCEGKIRPKRKGCSSVGALGKETNKTKEEV